MHSLPRQLCPPRRRLRRQPMLSPLRRWLPLPRNRKRKRLFARSAVRRTAPPIPLARIAENRWRKGYAQRPYRFPSRPAIFAGRLFLCFFPPFRHSRTPSPHKLLYTVLSYPSRRHSPPVIFGVKMSIFRKNQLQSIGRYGRI